MRQLIYFGTFLALVIAIFAIPRLLLIHEIECESQFGPCDPKTNEALNKFLGKSIVSAKKDITDYLRGEAVKKFAVRYLLPDKIKVVILQKKAEFGLSSGNDKVALADRDGNILSYQDSTLLPTLTLAYTPPINTQIDKEAQRGLRILGYLSNLFDIRTGRLENSNFYTKLKEGQSVVIPLDEDIEARLGALIMINNELNKASNESRMDEGGLGFCRSSCTIDLRYKDPVVKY